MRLSGMVEMPSLPNRKNNDKRKRDYAQQHGIPLIEVPFDVISYDDTVKLLQFSGVV